MDPAVVGDDLRGHRKDPGVPGLGQDVYPDTGQRAVRRNEMVVDTVDAGHESPDAGKVHPRHRGASENAGAVAGSDERSKGLCRQHHVGIEVDPGVRPARRVAHRDRMRLSGYRCLDDAYVERPRDRRGVVTACIRHHDHVEFAGPRGGQQSAQICGDYCRLVVGRNDDTHHRPAGVAVRQQTSVHADLRISFRHLATYAPLDRIAAIPQADRSDTVSLLSITPPAVLLRWAM
jgi:hypothetical protein